MLLLHLLASRYLLFSIYLDIIPRCDFITTDKVAPEFPQEPRDRVCTVAAGIDDLHFDTIIYLSFLRCFQEANKQMV